MSVPHIQHRLDPDDPNTSIKAVIKEIKPELDPENLEFFEFTEGISNKLVGCRPTGGSDQEILLFRIYGNKTELFIDRKKEIATYSILNPLGYAPPVYATFENGFCYGFMVGSVMCTKTVCDPHISSLIAKHVADLHAIKLQEENPQPSWYKAILHFFSIIPDKFPHAAKENRFKEVLGSKAHLLEEVKLLNSKLDKLESAIVFAHNDLLCKNIIYNKDKDSVCTIDFEYANPNPIAYDIANHFCEYAGVDEVDYSLYPQKDHQVKFLESYLKRAMELQGEKDVNPSSKEIEKLYVHVNQFALAAHFFWGVWGLVQAHYSEIDFDFLEYAITRLNEYYLRKEKFLSLTCE
ncbi:probable ethanolamine kinase isoform X2 [Nematostella vectensis]|uniref:probable ethanolamine kinase isoform X2 n=1 Tax=Nematostella vectensis TaxID=45351 RepID=UPI00207721DA|nr:probable ethanolamine kinase isoform X2 [Nematostella vectensis]